MDQRERLCDLGHSLYQRGLTHGSTGNLSVRLDDGTIAVTPTGVSLGRLTPENLSILDAKGDYLSGPKPTKEVPLHLAFYQTRGDRAGAIVHLHSCYATALSLIDAKETDDWLPHLTPYGIMQLGKVRLLPYYMPGSSAIGTAISGLAGRHAAVMLANHGPVVSAKTIEAATYAAEELEATAKLALLTRSLEPNALTPAQVHDLVRQFHVEWT